MPSITPTQFSNIKTRLKEAGNVLFIILIAVALFAALAYAVTQSTRSGGGDASKETTILLASQIVQYGIPLQTSIERMRISNGCTDTQISFENPIISGYTNASSPANYNCHVFRPEGGSIAFQSPPSDVLDQSKSLYPNYGSYVYTVNYVSNLGTDDNPTGRELMVLLPYLKRDICIAINDKLGVGTKGSEPADANGYMGSSFNWNGKWQGSYTISGVAYIDHTIFRTKQSGCTRASQELNTGTSVGITYIFYHVLIPR